ncbi:MAG: NAD(P)-dependent oxidoreductase [Candidatus Limnocylindrales bacterium]
MSTQPGVVGIIGLGQMGGRMARVLDAAGLRVVAWDLFPGALEVAARNGIEPAPDPAAVAEAAAIVITSLPDISALRAVVYGARGLAAAGRADLLIVDTTTLTPEQARLICAELAARGIGFLDGPVSGGTASAEKGTLGIMVGGERALYERALPVLSVIGSKVVLCGPIGSGQVVKAANQLIVVATLGAVGEALAIARAAGVDPALARDVMLAGYAGSPVLDNGGGRMIQRDFAPGGKAAFNMKDIAALEELSRSGGVPIPVFEASARYIEALVAAGGGDLDHAAIIDIIEKGKIEGQP